MQQLRVLADEPAPPADPEAGTVALVRQHLASAVASTSKGQAALDTADRYAGNAHAHATNRAYRLARRINITASTGTPATATSKKPLHGAFREHGRPPKQAAALRRSELVGLKVSDITAIHDGLEIRLGRPKTDQDGKEASIGLPRSENRPTCPVRALS